MKKHLRAQEIAAEEPPAVRLPRRLWRGLPAPAGRGPFRTAKHFGRIFYNEARLSAAGIAQISVVLGSCTAGAPTSPR